MKNDRTWGRKVVTDPGDSENVKAGQIVTAVNCVMRTLEMLKRRGSCAWLLSLMQFMPHPSRYSRASRVPPSRHHPSFMSAAIIPGNDKRSSMKPPLPGKVDKLEGMKEKRYLRTPYSCRYRPS